MSLRFALAGQLARKTRSPGTRKRGASTSPLNDGATPADDGTQQLAVKSMARSVMSSDWHGPIACSDQFDKE